MDQRVFISSKLKCINVGVTKVNFKKFINLRSTPIDLHKNINFFQIRTPVAMLRSLVKDIKINFK